MAGRIRDEDIALVRERSAVEEVVGEYLQLRSAGGGSLKGLCPFHDEKTPSFNVTPARGLWYCFSCTEGGDVIKFVQRIENLSFAEAVERLAARAGIELRYEQGGRVPGRDHSQRRRLIEAHRAAADFYLERIAAPQAGSARAFLSSRGFAEADWARFGIGYAPAEWDALTRHLRGRGFTDEELVLRRAGEAGQARPDGHVPKPADLADRGPVGDVIAFGARKLAEDDNGPKYLNTPETPLFKKSQCYTGWIWPAGHRAAPSGGDRRGLHGRDGLPPGGITTAVATSGTSFGVGHIKILRGLMLDRTSSWPVRSSSPSTGTRQVSGRSGARFEFDPEFVTQTMFALQPDGLDPCDLRIKEGDAAVRDLVAQRVPVYEFAIRRELAKHNLDTNEGRLAALDAAAAIVGHIKDYGLRDRYAVSLDRWLGMMDEDFVLAECARVLHPRLVSAVPGARPRSAGTVRLSAALDCAATKAPAAWSPRCAPVRPVRAPLSSTMT